jgi:hypothetical protein
MATVLETCTAAMELAGVLAGGETASATDAQRVFRALRGMLESWGTERNFIYVTTQQAITATGATSYTIGEGTPAADIVSVRPNAITDDCFWRTGSSDYPLYQINRQEYNEITNKSEGGLPGRIFYDATYPNGTLYVWPIPSSGTIYLNSVKPLAALSLISDSLSYPPGYQRAIEYSLAEEIEGLFDLPVPPSVHTIAAKARRNIKRLNAEDRLMHLPSEMMPRFGYLDINWWS